VLVVTSVADVAEVPWYFLPTVVSTACVYK